MLTLYRKESARNKYKLKISAYDLPNPFMNHTQPISALIVIFNNRSGGMSEDLELNWFRFAN